MAANVDHVVDAPHDPVIAVIINAAVVARQIVAGDLRPILLHVTLVIAPNAAEHAGPRLGDAEHTALITTDGLQLLVEQHRHDAGHRLGAAAGFGRDRAWKRAHHDAARF